MALTLLKVCAAFYGLVAALGVVQLVRSKAGGARVVLFSLMFAVITHALALGGRSVELQSWPVAGLHDGLSLCGFFVALLAMGIAWRAGVPQTVPLASILVFGLVASAAMLGPSPESSEALRSTWLPVHIGLAFFGDAAFAVAGLVSLVYLIQERRLRLKKRRLKRAKVGLKKLPALEVLDRVSVRLIQIGFPLMTLGLISGVIYSGEVRGRYWTWDPLNVVSALVWLLYAVLLHVRLTIGWRGRKAAVLTLLGVAATLVVFAGLGLRGQGAHTDVTPSGAVS